MDMVKLIYSTIMITLTLINLGCFSRKHFTDSETVKKDLLNYLENKYHEEFIIKSVRLESNVSGKTVDKHFVVLTSKKYPDKEFDAKVSYANPEKKFELLFEYYTRILINEQANAFNKKVIDKYLEDYSVETKVLNLIKLTEDEIPSKATPYFDFVKKNPDKWTAEVTIETNGITLSKKVYENLLWELIEDHKKRYHQSLNLIVKGPVEGYQGDNHVLKLANIGLLYSRELFLSEMKKSMHF